MERKIGVFSQIFLTLSLWWDKINQNENMLSTCVVVSEEYVVSELQRKGSLTSRNVYGLGSSSTSPRASQHNQILE